jgi:hypothetical protein
MGWSSLPFANCSHLGRCSQNTIVLLGMAGLLGTVAGSVSGRGCRLLCSLSRTIGFLAWLEDLYVFFWLFLLARNFRRGISGKRVCSSNGVG